MNIASIDDKSKGDLAFQDSVVFEEDSELSIISINDSTRPDKKIQKSSDEIVNQYQIEMYNIILNDEIEDGTTSASECYIKAVYDEGNKDYIKTALMNLYLNNLGNEKVLTGVLVMISSLSYEESCPQGPIMAMGLLQNKSNTIRDRAIQAFERWNSKKALTVLESLKCDKKWLQDYVDKVILYIKRDGID